MFQTPIPLHLSSREPRLYPSMSHSLPPGYQLIVALRWNAVIDPTVQMDKANDTGSPRKTPRLPANGGLVALSHMDSHTEQDTNRQKSASRHSDKKRYICIQKIKYTTGEVQEEVSGPVQAKMTLKKDIHERNVAKSDF